MWRAIEQPVLRRGEHVAPQLVARLLDDAAADADQLPKLEHALMRTWDAWSKDHAAGEPLDERQYEQIGEMRGALSKHANDIYDALDPRLAQVAERLFRCLTARDSENRSVRRPMPVSAVLAATAAKPGEIEQLVRIYAAPGVSFLTASGPLSNPTTILDIAHESLMRLWDRLRAWVADEGGVREDVPQARRGRGGKARALGGSPARRRRGVAGQASRVDQPGVGRALRRRARRPARG